MYAETFAPIDKRQMTFEDGLRPQLINLYRCNTILIENVTLKNSPFWVIHPLFCESLTVRGVKVSSHGPNSDGCDPESSKNVLIETVYSILETTALPLKADGMLTDGNGMYQVKISLYAIAK